MKTKLIKILGVLATVATLMSLIGVAPVAADTQAWSAVATPGTTGYVLNNVASPITAMGPMAQSSDGKTLWVFAVVNAVNRILKSTNDGRSWANSAVAAGPVVAFAASPTEPNVLYYATASTVYKSVDGGATFAAEANMVNPTPGNPNNITSLAVAQYSGRYIVVAGTQDADAGDSNVYWFDENTAFYNFTILGTNSFAAASGAAITAIRAVATTPTFGTDRSVVAIGVSAANAYVQVDVAGGAWNAAIANGTVALAGVTTAAIAFPSDFSISTSPYFFFGLGTATTGSIYRFLGVPGAGPSIVNSLPLSGTNPNAPIVSLDAAGAFSAASIVAGSADGRVELSTNAGSTVSTTTLNPANALVYAMFKKGTPTMIYALAGGTVVAGYPDNAFYLSQNTGSNYHAVSLIINTLSLKTLEVTPNGEVFMVTTGNAQTSTADEFTIDTNSIGDQFTLTATAAGTYTVTSAGTVRLAVTTEVGAVTTTITPTGTGAGPFTITFGDVGDIVTVYTMTAGAITYAAGTGTATAAETFDPNASQTVPAAPGVTVGSDINTPPVVLVNTTAGSVSISANPTSILAGNVITFTGTGQVATVKAGSAATTVVLTLASGTSPTLTATVGAVVPTFAGPFAMAIVYSSASADFLWRFYNSNWERVFKASGTTLDIVKSSPAYATDKTLFTADAGTTNALQKSTNNGDSFSAQTSRPGSTTVPGGVTVNALLVVDPNTVVVGSTAGVITRTVNNGFLWMNSTITGMGTITDLRLASNGDLLAASVSGGFVTVAKALAANVTPTTMTWGSAYATTDASATVGYVAPAADYATSGVVYVSGDTAGVYWGVIPASGTTSTWYRADANATWTQVGGSSATILGGVQAPNLITTPGGPGFTDEGTGMAYTAAQTAVGVARVKGRVATTVTSSAESLTAPKTAGGADIPVEGLWAASGAAVGNVVLYTVGTDSGVNSFKVYTYTDTLNKPVTGVAVSNIQTSTGCATCPIGGTASATIKWDAMANANYYLVIVDSTQHTNFYAAMVEAATAAPFPYIAASITSSTSVTFTDLLPADATSYVSVWAFKFTGTGSLTGSTAARATAATAAGVSSFGMGQTIITPPAAPLGLAPAPAAQSQPIMPVFQWNAVPGATSYKLQVADNANFTSPVVDATVTGTSYAYTGTALKYGTAYFWRVAAVTASGTSAYTVNTFTTATAPVSQPIIITAPTQPAPTITVPIPTITVPPITLPPISINLPTPTITLPPGTTTTVQPIIEMPEAQTPVYIWIIVAVGGLLTIAVIVLIVRTRRVV